MTGRHPDTEQTIREWLAESAPNRAPASLREALDDVTAQPAGRTLPWPRSAGRRLRLAGRVAAAAAVVAVVASGAYLLGTRPAEHGLAPASPSTVAPSSAATAIAAVPTTRATSRLEPTVLALAGSSWKLVGGALPRMVAPAFQSFPSPVFALPGGGFLAFVPSETVATRPSGNVLVAFRTAGPTSPTSWETHVFRSADGLTWNELTPLPSTAAIVRAVTQSGGRIVAVGWTAGAVPIETPVAWSTTDLQSWQATNLPLLPDGSTVNTANGVAAGPGGFLAWGYGQTSTLFWASTDGVAWHLLTSSGLPADKAPDSLLATPSGYVISINMDTTSTWESSDGAVWTRAWQGPAWTLGSEGYFLGPIVPAASGERISFGWAGMPSGGPAAAPGDLQLWTSTDLAHWTISDRVPRPGWMDGFASIPGGYVTAGAQASGQDAALLPLGSLGVWTSADGRSWQQLAGLPPESGIEVVSVVGDGRHAVIGFVDQQGNLQLLVGDGLK
jgi:hypothetical protein